MEVLVLGGTERLEAEVVDDQEIDGGQFSGEPIIVVDGPGGIELSEHFTLRGEQDVIADSHGGVAEGLGDVAFALMESFP